MAKEIKLSDLINAKDQDKLIQNLSFEDGIKLLEELVVSIESGSLSLDSAINSYEKGKLLVEKLRAQLVNAEEKLNKKK